MRKPLNRSGQSLVEMMILLPVAFFFFLVLAELLMLIRVAVTLQHSAARIAYQSAVSAPSQMQLIGTLTADLGAAWRWGLPDPSHSNFQEEPLQGWHKYFGFGTTNDTPPKLVTVQAAYELYPRFFFGRLIPARSLRARCALPEQTGEVDPS